MVGLLCVSRNGTSLRKANDETVMSAVTKVDTTSLEKLVVLSFIGRGIMKRSVLAFAIALFIAVGQAATAAAASGNIDGEEIRGFDFGYEGAPQGDREAGAFRVVFTNLQSPITDPGGFHEIIVVRIAAAHRSATKKQIIAAIAAQDFCASGCFFDYLAGAAFAAPGATSGSVGPKFMPGPMILLPGRYAYFCAIPENGTPHFQLGMFGTFWAK
jgi:hypothetical protein